MGFWYNFDILGNGRYNITSQRRVGRSTQVSVSDWDRANIGEILAGKGDWFDAKLFRLIRDADSQNRKRLRQIFPEEVELVEAWQTGQLTPVKAG